MSMHSTIRNLLAAASLATGLAGAPALAETYGGGGSLTSFDGCQAQGWSNGQMLRARFVPADDNDGVVNLISLFLPNGGAINLSIVEPFERATAWRRLYLNHRNPHPHCFGESAATQLYPRHRTPLDPQFRWPNYNVLSTDRGAAPTPPPPAATMKRCHPH